MTLKDITDEYRCCCSCKHNARIWDGKGHCTCTCCKDGHYISYAANFDTVCEEWEDKE